MEPNLLIVFAKEPQAGKVKTRLAADIGVDSALLVYNKLLNHTLKMANEANGQLEIHWANQWNAEAFFPEQQHHFQKGVHLGQRMMNATESGITRGFQKVVLIGSDCPNIDTDIINQAFESLNQVPIVFGPALDGGYFLVGMAQLFPSVFDFKEWSNPNVLKRSLDLLNQQNVNYFLLDPLNDIDTIEDLNKFPDFAE